MKFLRLATSSFVLALALCFASPLHAQTAQASLAKDTQTLSTKFTGLARVMAGKYDWKPGTGIRSVGEVFNLIVAENGMLLRTVTGATGPAEKPVPITDPEKLQAALKDSYAALDKAISALSDSDLKASVKLFGREMTKEDALHMLLSDQHEHLGQSIAYARMNGVVPPWSK
ncbi:DinB family protein [Terriglobus tenax]|uniref:DinB family protein n=1 Tax=Terriglobus tenax TaxID=1111115 RepID=UPI0021DFE3D0|nr:DinB family protein [Terriglobus tenax]